MRQRRLIVASWVLIWFGTVLCVNARPALAAMGAALWIGGIAVQASIGLRWSARVLHPRRG